MESQSAENSDAKVPYDRARHILEQGNLQAAAALASHPETEPEILYYLAEHGDVSLRQLIAANPSTPLQASDQLASDENEEVRAELATRVARLMPDLDDAENTTVREAVLDVLERLASDQLPRIRSIVSDAIKQSNLVPKEMVKALAADVEAVVAVPVLEYSPLLQDDDLRELIAAGVAEGALEAIARRETVSEDVAGDIVVALEIPAVAALLANPQAAICEDTMQQIIDQAESTDALHAPIAMRAELSIRSMRRIAGFVVSALVHLMLDANPAAEDAIDEIIDIARDRISSERIGAEEEARLAEQASRLHADEQLDDTFVRALVKANKREFTIQCLAVLTEFDVDVVREILISKSGRLVTALAWKAGLQMRTAYALQTQMALVPPGQIVQPKDGIAYPLERSELEWQITSFVE